MKTHQVIFQPSGRRGKILEGKTVLEAARSLGVGIKSVCGGKKTCGKCRIRIDPGTLKVSFKIIGEERWRPEFIVAWREETALDEEITIGQQDVRSVQLAKGALYTGAKLMMKRLGIKKLDRVIFAGAFGSYIDKTAALILGMFPDCDLDCVSLIRHCFFTVGVYEERSCVSIEF